MENLIIRDVKLEDAKALSKIRKMNGVIQNILASPMESANMMKCRIGSKTENEFWFVAEVEGKVIGMIALNKYPHHNKYHSGTFTIMINPTYHKMGIGKRLMEEVIKLSDNELKLKRVELTVFESNDNAIKLYEKFGFIKEGKKEYSVITESGFEHEVLMARII